MDAYQALREQAADKRDAIISTARQEFRATIRQIEKLRETLGDGPQKKRDTGATSIAELIPQVMPRDRTFTLDDLVLELKKADPTRQFQAASVRTILPDLAKAGLIRKVCRTLGGIVHWAHPDCPVEHGPIEALNIVDAARLVLEELGPLTAAEIVVNLKERGYRADTDPRVLLRTLRYAFKRNRERFTRGDGGRWSVLA